MKILVTGVAGFIGFHLAKKLCLLGHTVVGLDNLNDYYSVQLKLDRLKVLKDSSFFSFEKIDLVDSLSIEQLFQKNTFDCVINLAAQAGVRYSIENPKTYINSNIVGFLNVLEGCRYTQCNHLIFASSSSVYGLNATIPFSETDRTDSPVSLYAATKKSNEVMAHSYSHLFSLPATGLRFFTVYGPYGRPDMALFSFTKAIIAGEPISIFNNGDMKRDFTYIDDIIEGIVGLINKPPLRGDSLCLNEQSVGAGSPPFAIYNIGNNKAESLLRFIEVLETALGKKARKVFLPMQDGDVKETFASIDKLHNLTSFTPYTSIEVGIKSFVDWYKEYYGC